MTAIRTDSWRQWLARYHDLRVSMASQPAAAIGLVAARSFRDGLHVPGVGAIVNSPATTRAILLDEAHFSKRGPGGAGVIWTQLLGERALTNMEGDEHRQLRRHFAYLGSDACLRAVEVEALEPLRRRAESRLAAGLPIDIVRYAKLLAAKAIHHALGILPEPPHEIDEYRRHYRLRQDMRMRVPLRSMRLAEADSAHIRAGIANMLALTARRIEAGEVMPGRLIDRLLLAGMSAAEILPLAGLMLFLGTETVSTAIPRVVALLIDSGQLAVLAHEPALLDSAIDEGLRLVAPSPVLLRGATANARIGQVRFRAGRRIIMNIAGMFRDPLRYPAPGRVDIRRAHPPETKSLWFGYGPHYCLGGQLAVAEIASVLRALAVPGRTPQILARRYNGRTLLPGYRQLVVGSASATRGFP